MTPCRESRPPGREQPVDMEDDMTVLHTTPYHMSYLPMSSLTPVGQVGGWLDQRCPVVCCKSGKSDTVSLIL
jgi:hypothetical protein